MCMLQNSTYFSISAMSRKDLLDICLILKCVQSRGFCLLVQELQQRFVISSQSDSLNSLWKAYLLVSVVQLFQTDP